MILLKACLQGRRRDAKRQGNKHGHDVGREGGNGGGIALTYIHYHV